jgi:integrase
MEQQQQRQGLNKQANNNNNYLYPDSDRRSQLDRLLQKAESQGLKQVVDFLIAKARKSPRTARLYYHGLDNLGSFIREYCNGDYDIQTIIPAIKNKNKNKKVDLYTLLNSFVSFLQQQNSDFMPGTIVAYVTAAKSYFAFNDIDISPNKYRYRVSLPALYKEDEQPIDAADIRQILSHCNNRRLKAYLFVLASGGMRAMEALGIREIDLDFSGINFADPSDTSEPAGVRIRKEFSKTKRERNIFISNEAARYLNEWLEWKYHNLSNPVEARKQGREDLVFTRRRHTKRYPIGLYDKISFEFHSVLAAAGFTSRKEEGVFHRRTVTFHSFRRFVKTTIANQTGNSDYSEWFLGHIKSAYYTNKPEELKRIYKENCMKYVTFLDYPTVEATGRSFEAKIKEKDKEIARLNQNIINLQEQLNQDVVNKNDEIKQLQQQFEELKAAISGHIKYDVKEKGGATLSPQLTDMLYHEDKERIDKAVAKYKMEHNIID